MAYQSGIEWTESTWNPVTGCTKVSAGCKFCYAERFAERFRGVKGHPFEHGFDLVLHEDRLSQPFGWRKPRIVFVNSMSDLFHEDVPLTFIKRVFEVMEASGRHTFQVLTKRAERMARLFADKELPRPAANVWIGVSVENQQNAWRVEELRKVEADVRFLSCEPLLGPLDIDLTGIGWVIVGGESGPGARPMLQEWAIAVKSLCGEKRIPFFFKQWGGVNKKKAGRVLERRTWDGMPEQLKHQPYEQGFGQPAGGRIVSG